MKFELTSRIESRRYRSRDSVLAKGLSNGGATNTLSPAATPRGTNLKRSFILTGQSNLLNFILSSPIPERHVPSPNPTMDGFSVCRS